MATIKLNNAEQALLNRMLAQGTPMSYDAILATPGPVKSWKVRWDRNDKALRGLLLKRMVRQATAEQVAERLAAFNRHTDRIEHRTIRAALRKDWRTVTRLAELLGDRKFDTVWYSLR